VSAEHFKTGLSAFRAFGRVVPRGSSSRTIRQTVPPYNEIGKFALVWMKMPKESGPAYN